MDLNEITHEILDSAYKVHSKLGPGLLESAYQACLVYELRKKGLKVEVEKPFLLPFFTCLSFISITPSDFWVNLWCGF